MTVAVIDCPLADPNKQNLPQSEPTGAMDIFLVEPVGGFEENNFYAEIVGPAGNQNLTVTASNRVVLYE